MQEDLAALWQSVGDIKGDAILSVVHKLFQFSIAAGKKLVASKKMLLDVPRVSKRIVSGWDVARSLQPWCQLQAAVKARPSTAVELPRGHIFVVQGIGGAGKTTSCLLVAEKEDEEASCYLDGLFWIGLGKEANCKDVVKYLLAVASVVAGEKISAADVGTAVELLRNMLANKACLIVMVDCWDV